MTKKKSSWGGARPHPPDRKGGRPKNQYPTKLLKIQATDAEWAKILNELPDTRQRTEVLLSAINHSDQQSEAG